MNILFTHLSVNEYLGRFHLLAIVNNASMNMGVQVSVQVPAFNCFEYVPRRGIAGSYSNFIFIFLMKIKVSLYILYIFEVQCNITVYLVLYLDLKFFLSRKKFHTFPLQLKTYQCNILLVMKHFSHACITAL